MKSQILRFKIICTREVDFQEAVKILLRGRGYSRTFLRKCLKTFQDRKERDRGNLIPLITTYSSVSKILHGKLKDYFDNIIDLEVIPNSKVISAYRRNVNLKDILVKAKLPSLTLRKPQMLEAQFSRLKFIRNTEEKTILTIRQGFTSRSKNCVYVLFCVKCNKKYVGETKNTLSTRMNQHRYNMRNRKEVDTPLVKHFFIHGYDSVRMAGLQRDVNWTDWERKKMESRWIYLLSTREPFGLNVKYA